MVSKKNLKSDKVIKKKTDSFDLYNILIFALVLLVIGFLIVLTFKIFSKPFVDTYENENGVYYLFRERILGIDIYRVNVTANSITYSYPFRNHPKDLEDIYLEPGISSKLNRPEGIKVLYVTRDVGLTDLTDNYDVIAVAPLEQILGSGKPGLYRLNLLNAYTSFFKDGVDVISCDNANNDTAVIYVKLGTENKVYSQGECVIIEGKNSNGLILSAEKLAYHMLGVF